MLRAAHVLAAAAAAALLAAGCGSDAEQPGVTATTEAPDPTEAEPTQPEEPEVTETAAATEPPTEAAAEVSCPQPSGGKAKGRPLFETGFSDVSAWPVDDEQVVQPDAGCLVLLPAGTGEAAEAAPSFDELAIPLDSGGTLGGLPAMALEVDATPLTDVAGFWGVVCGVSPDLKFYLGVLADGSGVIARSENGTIETVARKPGGQPPAVGETVRLRAECDIGQFEASFAVGVGDEKLVSKKIGNLDIREASDTFQSIGVVAAGNTDGLQVAFDDLVMYQLGP